MSCCNTTTTADEVTHLVAVVDDVGRDRGPDDVARRRACAPQPEHETATQVGRKGERLKLWLWSVVSFSNRRVHGRGGGSEVRTKTFVPVTQK